MRSLKLTSILLTVCVLAAACSAEADPAETIADVSGQPTETSQPEEVTEPVEPTSVECIEDFDQRRSFDTVEEAPLVSWTSSDPWLQSIGSDSASFALYESGLVIWQSGTADDVDSERVIFSTATLDSEEVEEFMQSFNSKSFAKLDDHYELTNSTDQRTDTIAVNTSPCFEWTSVYGYPGDDGTLVPEPFQAVFDQVSTFDHPDAVEWVPPTVEVILDLTDRSSSFEWSDDWPDLEHPASWRRREGAYSLYFASEHFADLADRRSDGAYSTVSGETFQINHRTPFPHEVPANWGG